MAFSGPILLSPSTGMWRVWGKSVDEMCISREFAHKIFMLLQQTSLPSVPAGGMIAAVARESTGRPAADLLAAVGVERNAVMAPGSAPSRSPPGRPGWRPQGEWGWCPIGVPTGARVRPFAEPGGRHRLRRGVGGVCQDTRLGSRSGRPAPLLFFPMPLLLPHPATASEPDARHRAQRPQGRCHRASRRRSNPRQREASWLAAPR